MYILWALIIGLVVGAVAKFVMPGKDPGGVIITILLGIVGSIVGGFIGRALFGYGGSGDDYTRPGFFMSLVLAVVGAVILLAAYRLITHRSLRA